MQKNKALMSTRKLPALRRDTLRSLSETEMKSAAGGSAGMSCCGDCTGSGFLSCIIVAC
jgi:hypothetical protein